MPDARVLRAGEEVWLLAELGAPSFHLLLCGPPDAWDDGSVESLRRRFAPWLTVLRLAAGGAPDGGREVLVDIHGAALPALRARRGTHFVVRPDGHIGHRADGPDLGGASRYLAGVLSGAVGAAVRGQGWND